MSSAFHNCSWQKNRQVYLVISLKCYNRCKNATCFFVWIWILLSVHHDFLGFQGTIWMQVQWLMTFTPRGGFWTFLASLILCVSCCDGWMEAKPCRIGAKHLWSRIWFLSSTMWVGLVLAQNLLQLSRLAWIKVA